ncbi:MAG: amidohydrolase family protein [Acidobacteria bacterium]|nr:amidohydrolase family protein [Acidobacteriota bacterium]
MRSASLLVMFMIAVTLPQPSLAQKKADMILYNGKVVTVDANFSLAEAIAIRGEKIIAVGKTDDVLRLSDETTQKIDLKGRTVIPGLIDTHNHFHSYGRNHYKQSMGLTNLREYPINWPQVKTKNDVLAQIAQAVKQYNFKPGELIFFYSIDFFMNPKAPTQIFYEELNMKDLDRVAPNNPIVISIGGGTRILNGVALVNGKLWNILVEKYGDYIKKYGRYWKDSSGNPTGLIESPLSQLLEHEMLPRPSAQVLAPMLKKELEEWSSMGVTTMSTRMDSEDVEALKILDRNQQLKVRIAYGMSDFFGIEDPELSFHRIGGLIGLGSSRLWINSFTPIIVDGGQAMAATDQKRIQPFGNESKYFPIGNALLDPEYRGASGNYYKDWFFAVARSGGRVANLHVGGDRSVRRMIEILEEINTEVPLRDRRWAIDHCSLMNPDHIERAVRLGIYFSCGPTFIKDSPDIERVYGERIVNTFVVPVKTLLNKGAKVSYQTDRHSYIWGDLQLLITRKVGDKVYAPQERVDKITALKMITMWAADYLDREKELGSLEVGKKADIAVLDKDYLNIPEEEVSEVQAVMTILDGEITHLHPQFADESGLKAPGAVVATYKELFARR